MKTIAIFLALLLSMAACQDEPADETTKEETQINLKKTDKSQSDFETTNKSTLYELADTLYYTAQLRPANEEESLYMNDWLKNLKLKEFTEMVFKAIYDGRLTAYSYTTDMPMTADEVKALEKENEGSEIAKLLFEEAWYFDEKNMKMYKEVRSVMFAYERKDSDGVVRGYKAGIKVFFNK